MLKSITYLKDYQIEYGSKEWIILNDDDIIYAAKVFNIKLDHFLMPDYYIKEGSYILYLRLHGIYSLYLVENGIEIDREEIYTWPRLGRHFDVNPLRIIH